jgi:hypothetical protein
MAKKQRPPRIGDFLKAGIQSPTLRQVPDFRLPEPIRYNSSEATTIRGMNASLAVEDAFEKMVIRGKSVLVADPNVVNILRSIEDPDYLVTDFNTTEEKMAGVETDIERLLAENKALKLLLEAEKGNSSEQRYMKDLARKQRDKVTKQLSEVTQILEFYKKGLDIGIEQDLECTSVKKGIEGFMKSLEK